MIKTVTEKVTDRYFNY